MLLPLPNLDDRRWSDLAEEGRNLIPRYAPEWTDFNVHDPGITLIELLAWLTEMDVFQLNQIPESHRRKFLALLGITPRPPEAAQAVVQFSLQDNTAPPGSSTSPGFSTSPGEASSTVELPATIEVETEGLHQNLVRFRTLDPLTVAPTELTALWRRDQQGWHNLTQRWQNQELLPMFGDLPAVDSAFYFGFSEPLPQDKTVTLYLKFSGDKSGLDERERLRAELAAAQPPQPPKGGSQGQSSPLWGARGVDAPLNLAHHSARTVWEFPHYFGDKISWRALDAESNEVSDETRACTLDGFVRVTLPAAMAAMSSSPPQPPRGGSQGQNSPPRGAGEADAPRYYLRCRLVSGEYDAPPVLQGVMVNAVAAEQAVSAGAHQFTIARNATISGPIPSVGAAAKFSLQFNQAGEIVELTFLSMAHEGPAFFVTHWQMPTGLANGLLGVELHDMGPGLGEPGQQIRLQPAPVQGQSVEVFTLEAGAWQVWSRRPDFDASSRSDRHFHLDETTGVVRFGDGEKGRPAIEEAPIYATFRSTQAERGNVPAARAWVLSDSVHNRALVDVPQTQARLKVIANPFPATGGAGAETFRHAEGRALEEVHRVTRAVTLADIEQLALTAPGTDLARVVAKANLDARYPCLQAPGMITVILLPNTPASKVQPSRGLRAAVQRYLDRRRIIGSRIEVVGPVYTEVTVQAQVQSQTGADTVRVQQDVIQALRDFFDPLHGGPTKEGWPFGRDIYRSEMLHIIDRVAGVENVVKLELIADDGEPSCGNLCLGPCGLVVSGQHEIIVD